MKVKDFIKIIWYKINFVFLCLTHKNTSICGHCCTHHVIIKDLGKNNSIKTGRHVILENCMFYFKGNNHKMIFADNIRISGVSFFFEKDNATIVIGEGTWIGPGSHLKAEAGTTLKIGERTLLAPLCRIRTTDSHYIYKEGKEINNPQDISIGNHCWLGEQVFVLKGAEIQDGCIVGARSIVTKNCSHKANSIIVGVPAKMIEEGVTWEL